MSPIRALLVLALVVCPAAVYSGPAYVDSRGHRVDLLPSQERIAVAIVAGRSVHVALAARSDLQWDSARRHSSGLWEIPLTPDRWGHGPEVVADLVERGLVARVGGAFVDPGNGRPFFLDRGVIVKLNAPVDGLPAEMLAPTGLSPVRELGHAGTTFLCHAGDARTALEGAALASSMVGVRWALPDFIVVPELYHQPDDPFYGEQWYHHQPNGAHIHSEEAWDLNQGDVQVVVAVIDTGLDEGHPDFDPARIVTGYSVPDDSNDPTPLADSINSHGTCCSGEIAASIDNDEGLVGVCPQCSLMGVLMFNEGSGTSISDGYLGIQYAVDNGAWVLSNSWGVSHTGIDMQPFYDAVDSATTDGRGGLGSVVLFASGNGDWFGNGQPIAGNAIANRANVMAVGGTDNDDVRVQYSNFGPNLSVVAPTGSLDTNDYQIATTDTIGDRGGSRDGTHWAGGMWGDYDTGLPEPDASGNYTRYFSGTSASCPIAAGVVAMVFSTDPTLTGAQARFIVEQTADKVGPTAYDEDGHSNYYGYGRVNVGRAVRAADIGFDNTPGSVCAESFNCALGECEKAQPDDHYGNCTLLDCSGQPDGTVCVDDDPCTDQTVCSGGVCAGVPTDCDDGHPCTDDACDPVHGCVYTHNQAPCDDGSLCTDDDVCANGLCTGNLIDCDDGDACTSDSCHGQIGCRHQPVDCQDDNPCTQDSCDAQTGCTHLPTDCDDGDACTLDDCAPWIGCRHQPADCDDGDACTADACDPEAGCTNEPVACDDGDACTADACDLQTGCTHQADPDACDDDNPCTDDSCDPVEGCGHEPVSRSCNDGDLCTEGDACQDGACVGEPRDCAITDRPCRLGVCDPATGFCEVDHLEDGTACDDGDPCTESDACQAGDCEGTPRECPSSDPCQVGVCDEQTGDCTTRNLADDTPCSTGDECIQDEICKEGVCGGGTVLCASSTSCNCGGAGTGGAPWLALLALLALLRGGARRPRSR